MYVIQIFCTIQHYLMYKVKYVLVHIKYSFEAQTNPVILFES